MWLEITYRPTSLFSLRKSDSTNTSVKSLIAPSPYSIKMALLNSIITFDSLVKAQNYFNTIKNLEIQYNLSNFICVNNCFVKIQKEPHSTKKKSNPNLAFATSVGFREYIYYNDVVKFAIKAENEKDAYFLNKYFRLINYFGKRGSFFQYINSKIIKENILPCVYTTYFEINKLGVGIDGLLVKMDDFDSKAKFEDVNTYSSKKVKRDEKIYLFKYEQVKAGKKFTLYKQVM